MKKKLSLILALTLIICSLGCVQSGIAFAAGEDIYTDVLEDLQKDETFDVSKFPAKETDYSLNVFQVAESSDGELFLYVYQPSADKVTASEVRISQTIGENVKPMDYKLTLLSLNGTLAKYKVDELQLKTEQVRYYLIVQIARPWDKNLGDKEVSGNPIKTVPYAIEKLFTAVTVDGKISYTEEHAETIQITAKYCGYIRDFAGWAWLARANTDSHFIAFDTDRKIDELVEATVTYDYYPYKYRTDRLGLTIQGSLKEYPEQKIVGEVATLKAENEVTTPTVGLFGKKHTWKEIQTVSEFLKQEEVTDDVREQMQGKKWVLRFALTSVIKYNTGVFDATTDVQAFRVSDASILRLKYITAGITYDLAVVDNKQTEDNRPSSPTPDSRLEDILKKMETFWDKVVNFFKRIGTWFTKYWWIVLIVVGVIALGLLAIFVKPVAKILWWILKIIFYIVTCPFWIIYAIVRAVKNKKDGGTKT